MVAFLSRLRDRSLLLRLLDRLMIAQILRILLYPIDNIIGITLFALIIISWKQIDQLR